MRFLDKVRASSGRMVLELGCLGLLALIGTTLPPRNGPLTGWDFMAPALAILGHVVLGTLVLAEAVVLAVRSSRLSTGDHVSLPAVGLAAVIVAVGAGAAFLAGADRADIRAAMLVGWSVAVLAYAAEWRRASVALTRVATLPGGSDSLTARSGGAGPSTPGPGPLPWG